MLEIPLLWRACLAGDVASMTTMIDRGMDPHQDDRNGENCVHMTARSGEVEAIQMLKHRGIDMNPYNHNGQTPLHIAVAKENLETVLYIVKNGGDMNMTTKYSGMTALHMACRDSSTDIVRILIDSGANCAVKDKIGKYPDFYTTNSRILSLFDAHFDSCTHGRGRKRGRDKLSGDAVSATIMTDHGDEHDEKQKKKKKKRKKSKERERKTQEYQDVEHGDVEIYDKMETYDQERAQKNWDTLKHESKKVQINHGLGFSDEHKKRMQRNVFDRLMTKGNKTS